VRDVRKDLDAPGLPFVIATSGFGGWAQEHPRRVGIVEAQRAVARSREFEASTRAVETRGFWREAEESPSKQGNNWNHNAETHFLIGEAMGLAMLELMPESETVVLADFEGEDYGDWRATGEAFGTRPARGTLEGQMLVSGYEGRGFVNTYLGGDEATGTLTSPPFTLERRYVNFLIGGGGYEGKTCIDLLVAGEVVRTATGPNVRPGGSEELHWATWDVRDLLGERAVLRIVDRRKEGWGHVNVDEIELSDRRRTRAPAETRRELELREGLPWLNLPVKNGAPKRRLELSVDGVLVHALDVELAVDEPDWWAPLDVSALAGRRATIEVDSLERGSCGLSGIHQTDHVRGEARLYDEWLRPQLHFSQRRGWSNDPNGLVWLDGEYHLFFQHNPAGTQWANMHWGHAVSPDLVHWQELPIALFPWVQAVGHCYSGSAVVDARNTAGFRSGDEDVLVAVFTDTGCGEALAYSNDRGRTFTYYPKNPVVKHRGRDPKVFRHEPTGRWVMAVYDESEGHGANIAIHTSPDLREWTERSHLPGYYECPELFELSVDGDSGVTRWVVWAADATYALGAFDGETFTPEHEGKHQLHWGSYYASQTFNDAPDGRRIQIGWARIELEVMPFNQLMGFPTELSLRTTSDGVRLFAEPVRELETLRRRGHVLGENALRDGEPVSLDVTGRLFDVRATFAVGDAERFGLDLGGTRIVYDAAKHELAGMPLDPEDGRIHLQLVVDRPSLEVCGNRGRVYLTRSFRPGGEVRSIGAFAEGGAATLLGLEVYELESAWR